MDGVEVIAGEINFQGIAGNGVKNKILISLQIFG